MGVAVAEDGCSGAEEGFHGFARGWSVRTHVHTLSLPSSPLRGCSSVLFGVVVAYCKRDVEEEREGKKGGLGGKGALTLLPSGWR